MHKTENVVSESQGGRSITVPFMELEAVGRAEAVLEHQYSQATANKKAVLLITPDHDSHYQALRARYVTFFQNRQSIILKVNSSQVPLISFWPLRTLLEQVAPIIATEAPDILQNNAPELSTIHPHLMQQLGINADYALADIALTPSERRSHRESEQLFRLINNICSVFINAQQQCPSLKKAPLVIWWENLHQADRPSLLTFRRLNHWSYQAASPILLVATCCPAQRPSNNHQYPIDSPPFDWHTLHQQLFNQVQNQLLAETIPLADTPCLTKPVVPSSPLITGTQTHEAEVSPLALHYFQNGELEAGCAYALQAMRLAMFNLNLEAVLYLGQQIIHNLTTLPATQFDLAAFQQRWSVLTADAHTVALEFSLSTDMKSPDDICIAAWKAVALVHTFTGHHQEARDCYHQALALANTPAMCAQLYMYLALITGKRLCQIAEAQAYLDQGFAAIRELDDAAASLERGWLLNVSALMAFQNKQYNDAMARVQKSLNITKQFHHSEATHLKVNLISNISVLLESTGQLDQALKIWRFFRTFLNASNEVFTKHYFYREGGLLLKAGHLVEAAVCYQKSYNQAQAVNDTFHMKIIAASCGYLYYHQKAWEEAHRWYEQSRYLALQIGDYQTIPHIIASQALCCYQSGQQAAADLYLNETESLCQQLDHNDLALVQNIRQTLAELTPDMINEWVAWAIKPMGTKLNRPFYLVNLYA